MVNDFYFQSFEALKRLGLNLFSLNENIKKGIVTKKEVKLAEDFIAKSAFLLNPEVKASYWEHILISVKLGRFITEPLREKFSLNSEKVAFIMYFHDIGRINMPGSFFKNDIEAEKLFKETGLSIIMKDSLASTGKLLIKAEELDLTSEQIDFKKALNSEQKKLADQYFASLSPLQRVTNFADNLGKRDLSYLFDMEILKEYLRTLDDRYSKEMVEKNKENEDASIRWATSDQKRKKASVLQVYVLEETIKWLKKYGVDYDEIRTKLLNYSPKFIILTRHGEFSNSKKLAYNRDEDMKKEDIIHLSEKGKKQMEKLGRLLIDKGFNIRQIAMSPELRVKESWEYLEQGIKGEKNLKKESFYIASYIDKNLDEVFAPGYYKENKTIDDLLKAGGKIYDGTLAQKYNHEKPEEVLKRMRLSFMQMSSKLNPSETGVILSHGDPIAWLLNSLLFEFSFQKEKPVPENLQFLCYPQKGDSYVIVLNPPGIFFTAYSIKPVAE